MANETYFKNFKQIQYANNTVIDITERVVMLSNVQRNPYVYYPYDITNGIRADQLANETYKDPFTSWMLYLSNDVVDPYYEWYMDQNQFDEFIVAKYGSMVNAMQKIAFWRNDWVDKPNISSSTFQAESPERMKYWKPNYNAYGGIIDYSRSQDDWVVTTNKIVKYVVIFPTTGFIKNEVVDITFNDADNNKGTAQVITSSGSTLVVQHNYGTTIPGEGTAELQFEPDLNNFPMSTIVGRESGQVGRILSVEVAFENLSADEIVYWKPVTYYDMENQKNEGNRSIRVLQSRLAPNYIKNVKDLLKV
jgi:Base plate wedge protein 53